MTNILESYYSIRILEEIAEKDTVIHRIHPLIKVLTTIAFIITTVSFGKYDISRLLPLTFYPVILIIIADIPFNVLLKKMLLALPFIIGVGILNPFFDKGIVVNLPYLKISGGIISLLSILIRGVLTISAALILVTTTKMTGISIALRMLKFPKAFIMQILLMFRYISLLMDEVYRLIRGYSIRSPYKTGIRFRDWGSLTGQLLLRTYDRAIRVYQAMSCRGYNGDYESNDIKEINFKDITYILCWSLYFFIVRIFDVTQLIGTLIIGVGK